MHLSPRPSRMAAQAVSLLTLAAGLALVPPAGAGVTFTDVPPSHPFATEIGWAADQGITTGFADGTFRPGASVTRQAVVAFLYRAEGSPASTDPPAPTFSDVPASHPFFHEIEWAVAAGIAGGYADGTFRPGAAVTRGATAAFLFRTTGSPPGPHPDGGFPDVRADHPFSQEVWWLADAGVTQGVGGCRFGVARTVTREAMAVFLYRLGTDQPAPRLRACRLVSGLETTWDLALAPDGVLLYTVRQGQLGAVFPDGHRQNVFIDLGDLYNVGETGLMGLVLDPAFVSNRRFFTCQGVGAWPFAGIQVVRWQMNSTYTAATRQGVVVGPNGWAASQNGRHGGCRLRFGGAGALWISTGDAAVGTNPQDLTQLNGKTLRVDPATGQGAAGNPFAGSGNTNTRRIYTYGHRNAQGLAPRPGGGMWEVEQGTFRDDEVNLLIAGGNYGWDPVPGYDETTPMTDLTQFPGAQVARWSSGHPTVASSGGGWIDHERWGAWDGALAVACLKQEDIRVLHFDGAGVLQSAELPPELDGTFGRLRQPVVNPAGIMYIAGDGGITQVVPVGPGPV